MTGILPRLVQTDEPAPASVLVGTLGKSPLIDRLVEAGKLDASSVSGQWESYLIATVDDCLVIAGSDKRGTIYGIIMGTSHHEPMMRAHKEYTRRRDEVGEWNYATNKTRLDRFFRDGLERNRTYDNLITIGMRGDGDVAMGKGDDEENMQTLAKVVEGQRAIISEVYGRPASEVPQLWAIFTEVQRYYDKGFTVPDDVLLLFCDNNWGYIRRTGPLKERNRRGGMGLYYHIDMNGGPWNDRWVNTSPIPKLREQFHLAYETGIDDLWIVNVGDLKPKELPIDFILRYAWDPDAIPADRTDDYLRAWAGENFGEAHADAVAALVSAYPKYNLWRKAEVQVPGIFSTRATAPSSCGRTLPTVPTPCAACSLTRYYNDTLAGGKWKNMMQDIHIGYTQWSMPEKAVLPELVRVTPTEFPALGVSVEGSEATEQDGNLALPVFDSLLVSEYSVDLFNRGTGSLDYTVTPSAPWLRVSRSAGTLTDEARLRVSIDWGALEAGTHEGQVTIVSGDTRVPIAVRAVKGEAPRTDEPYFGNVSGSEFSIPAIAFNRNVPGKAAAWTLLPDLGRDEGCMGIQPVTAPSTQPSEAPRLEYRVLLTDADSVSLCIGILPTQDVNPERGLRLAVSLDDEAPLTLDARQGFKDEFAEYTPANLAKSPNLKPLPRQDTSIRLTGTGQLRRNEVFDNLRWLTVKLPVRSAGLHMLKVFMTDPEVVLERIVVNPDNRHPSYFGAPSVRHNVR